MVVTRNDLVVEGLRRVLADSYALYLKTQCYHWDVEGSNFKALHEMFEDQYTDLAEAIDSIAELIRGLGDKVLLKFKDIENLKTIVDSKGDLSADCMLKDLSKDQEIMDATLACCLKAAQESGDEVVIDALVDRMSVHRKNRWILISSLEKML